jgi:drug/metabolite transporter (DMT)-like permease
VTGAGPGVTAAVLFAAVLHATWNAVVKQVDDRLAGFVLLDLTGVALCLLAVPLLPGPAPASRAFLALSVVLHLGYKLFLMGAYRAGDLSQVYPLARGSAPLLVAGFAGLVLGERLGPAQLTGVLVVSVGLVLLAGVGAAASGPPAATWLALATGVFIAAYTVADGLGVRRSGSALGYTAWLFLLQGLALPGYAVATRWPALRGLRAGQVASGTTAGVLSLAAYGLVIWAQSRGALAVVAALRETSVVVAALIGSVVFGERFGRRRLLAAALVTAGIVALNLPR